MVLYQVTVRVTSIGLCTMLSVGAYAMADAPKRVDIPAGELSAALLKLSKQYGTELVYRPEQVRGLKTHGAHGKYTSEQWRSRAYSIRYFIGFTAAGASVGLVAWLYEQGGFVTMLHAFAALCLLVIAAAIILPREIRVPAAT